MGEERDLSDAYRGQIEGLPAPQGHGLNELYVRFFRIAERRIAQNDQRRGIFTYISNYSWLDGLSHPTMRFHLQRRFNSVYVDNLHGDRRISEYAPDGRTSETVFAMQGTSVGIKVGTAVASFVKTGEPVEDVTIFYRDFDEARASERRMQLLASVESEASYVPLIPNRILGLPFKPRTVGLDYLAWPRLPELFPTSFPGIKTSRDSLLVDIDRERLAERMRRYFDSHVSDAEIAQQMPSAMETGARFNPHATRAILLQKGFREWQILRYCYRPFDLRWLYWEPQTKLLDEKREDYVAQMVSVPFWIEARQRESGDSFSRGTVTRSVADNCGNGLSNFFPLYEIARSELLASEVVHRNLSAAALSWQASLSVVSEDLFFHALATMHTPHYRIENAGALLNDWPRIPLPATAELLTHSGALGRRLAELLDPESNVQLAGQWSFLARLSIAAEYPEGTPDRDRRNAARFAITAGWGARGQGTTVMPGRGKAPERDWTPTELDRLAILAAAQDLTPDAALLLLGPRCVDVSLNEAAYWAAIPINVWEYTLGGYQVLKKWLSYREAPLLGRPLHEDEARYFSQVVRRITAILLLGPALDASYAAVLPTACGLPNQ